MNRSDFGRSLFNWAAVLVMWSSFASCGNDDAVSSKAVSGIRNSLDSLSAVVGSLTVVRTLNTALHTPSDTMLALGIVLRRTAWRLVQFDADGDWVRGGFRTTMVNVAGASLALELQENGIYVTDENGVPLSYSNDMLFNGTYYRNQLIDIAVADSIDFQGEFQIDVDSVEGANAIANAGVFLLFDLTTR